MRIPWVISDVNTAETYSFEINPKDDGSYAYEKSITYKNTSSFSGVTVMFEGRDAPHTAQFTGTLLTEAQYNQFVFWFNKRVILHLVDDLGRSMNIYITKFVPKRKISRSYPWRHEYTCDYVIMA